jgi:hypothetical protein
VTYHSTSTGVYQLSVAHLVNKQKYFYNKDDIRKGTIMQSITIIQGPICNAQTAHAKISKTSHINQSMGSICTGACLARSQGYAPHNLGLVDHREPPVPPSPPLEELLRPRVLHVGYAHIINLLKIYARLEGNRSKTEATILKNIFPR